MNFLTNLQNFLKDKRKVAVAVIVFMITNSAFSLFIMEEAQQFCGFSTFIAQDTENWQIIEDVSIPCMETTIKFGQIYWYVAGWWNPIMVWSYRAYFFHAAPAYLEAARSVVRSKNEGVD